MKRIQIWAAFLGVLLGPCGSGHSAEVPKAPVPKSPFIPVVYRYADTMLKNGRDQNGLFLSALDRNTLAPLTNRPTAPEGVRSSDRVGPKDGPLVGSNPYHDENLLRLLSTLTDLSAKPHYRAAADVELKWFTANANPVTPKPFRPWLLWARCFELEPAASRQTLFHLSQQEMPIRSLALDRDAGFNNRALAVAYAHTKDEQFSRAIARLLDRYETNAMGNLTPSLAIDCEGAAHRVSEPLASRLRKVAAHQDELFCSLPHNVKPDGVFFSMSRDRNPQSRHDSLWRATHDTHTTAQVGMMCVSRYDNSGNIKYRELIFAAADAYLNSSPSDKDDVWPGTVGQAISLQLAAWRHSANWKYMERARKLGDFAVENFWGTNALPRASLKSEHYESITGADTLALALLELHLQILHITAVRYPPNTIDR